MANLNAHVFPGADAAAVADTDARATIECGCVCETCGEDANAGADANLSAGVYVCKCAWARAGCVPDCRRRGGNERECGEQVRYPKNRFPKRRIQKIRFPEKSFTKDTISPKTSFPKKLLVVKSLLLTEMGRCPG